MIKIFHRFRKFIIDMMEVSFLLGRDKISSIYIFLKIIFLVFIWKFIGKYESRFKFHFDGVYFEYWVSDRMDFQVLKEIFVDGEYLFPYENNPQTILDLGANVGDTAIFYAIKFPNAKIFAVEPNPNIFPRLIKNTSQFENILCRQEAVSDKDGEMILNIGPSHMGSSLINRDHNKNGVLVKTSTIKSFCEENQISEIDILKFDIEGAEKYLLSDKRNFQKVKQIAAEIHRDLAGSDVDGLVDMLSFKKKIILNLNEFRYIVYGVF